MTDSHIIYNVHIYREMRLYYPGIAASSPEIAAQIASQNATHEAETIEDCDGFNIAALVDVEGDSEYEKSTVIDFEPARLQKSARVLLGVLFDIKRLAEKSGDCEAEPFTLLDLIARKARAVLQLAKGGAI